MVKMGAMNKRHTARRTFAVTRCTLMLSALLLAAPALAQQDPEGEDEPQTRYQVEVLVFRHLDQSRNTAEISRLVEPELNDLLDQQLARLAAPAEPVIEFNDAATGETFWQPVATDKLVMRKDAERLERLDAYQLVSHLAWIQAAEDVAVAEGIAADELDPGSELSGTVKLYRKRYLHLAVDLTLGDSAIGRRGGAMSQLLPVNRVLPAIVDSRRMRLGRTVYFDQPEFGVLASVSRLQPADN